MDIRSGLLYEIICSFGIGVLYMDCHEVAYGA